MASVQEDELADEGFGIGDHEPRLVAKLSLLFTGSLLALAVFQSSALVTLAYDLEPVGMSEIIIQVAESWHGWMTGMGFAGVTEWVGDFIATLHQHPV